MQKLSDSELSIMMKIWEEDKNLYLDDMVEILEEYSWAESTIRNFLTRIIDKGYLKVEKDGRKNIYIPLVSKEYINEEGKAMLDELYEGSLEKFVKELYESDCVSLDELLEVNRYLDKEIYGNEKETSKKTEKIKVKDSKVKDSKVKDNKVEDSKEDDYEIEDDREDKVVLKRLKTIL